MNKLKKQNGITLIALVITIIVMLILVAVTITVAVNGGLFNYAGKAVGETQNAIDKEQELANLEPNMTVDDLIDKYTTKYTLADLGLKIGDEVDYNSILKAASDYTAPGGKTGYRPWNSTTSSYGDLTDQTFPQEQLTWKVMRQKGDNIILVGSPTSAGGPDSNGYVYLQGAEGYLYGPGELNNICKALYSYRDEEGNTISEARSMNEEDMLYLSGYNPSTYVNEDEYYGRKLLEVRTGETYKKYPYDNNGTAEIRDGFPDYMVINSYEIRMDKIEASDVNKELIFLDGWSRYWVASIYIDYYPKVTASFGVRMIMDDYITCCNQNQLFTSDGACGSEVGSLRPVISLTSSVVKAIIEAE